MSRILPRFLALALTVLLVAASSPLWAAEVPLDLSADSFHITPDNQLTATGAVQVVLKELKVQGELLQADLNASTAFFKGPVTLTGRGETVKGQGLSINLKTREWKFDTASAELSPQFLKGAKAPVFVEGSHLDGTDKLVNLSGCDLTSCGLKHPHFMLKAKSIAIYPGDKLVAKGVTFLSGGKRVFWLPRFEVPLQQSASRQFEMPLIGQSVQEGAFVKTSYNYMATRSSHGALKLDLMQKMGVGAGLEQGYTFGGATGTLSLYQFLNSGQRTGRLQHSQKLGDMRLQLNADFRDNSYQYAPSSRTKNIALYLTRNVKASDTSLSLNTNSVSGYQDFRNNSLTSSFQHTQRIGTRLLSSLALDYSNFSSTASGSTNSDSQLNSRLDFKDRLPNFDFALSANKHFALGGSSPTQFYSGVQKLPEMSLTTDGTRFKNGLLAKLPIRMSIGYGNFLEQPTNIQTSRMLLQMDMSGKEWKWGQTGLNITGGFRQTLYGDSTAQYMITENVALTRNLGGNSQASLNYSYQRPYGWTPFRFDYVVPYKVSTGRVNWEPSKKLNVLLATGYDFLSNGFHWQDALLRTTYKPIKGVEVMNSATYDLNPNTPTAPNRRGLRGITTRLKLDMPNGFVLDAGARLDARIGYGTATRSRIGAVKAHVSTPMWGKWKIEAYLGQDGYMKYRDIMLTRDLHCWEASVIYVNEGGVGGMQAQQGFRFAISLKAFPFQQRFGIGQFGQSLDSGIGEIY